MLVELGLSDANDSIKVVIRKCGVEDGVTVVPEVSRFATAWGGLPTVEEEDVHLVTAEALNETPISSTCFPSDCRAVIDIVPCLRLPS